MARERFPFAPIESLMPVGNTSAMARSLNVDAACVYRWRKNGLTVDRADELAVRIGRHPAQLWPEHW